MVELRIDSIGTGGEGVGRLEDGRACFVPRTAPGDRVEVRIRQNRSRWARATLLQLLESGPDRRDAPCPLYRDCGGCQLQHLDYDAQVRSKGLVVRETLTRLGRLDVPEPVLHPAEQETRYRNRVTFSLRRLGGDRVVAGFRSLSQPRRIVPVRDQCLLPEPGILTVWTALQGSWGPGADRLPPGPDLRLTLRSTSEGVLLLVQGGSEPGQGAEALLAATPGLTGIWWAPEGAGPRFLAGPGELEDRWRSGELDEGPVSFVQVNREMGALLESLVMDALSPARGTRIVDAYCGSGAYGAALAADGAIVTGIELETEAIRAARRRGVEGMKLREGRVEDLLPRALPADALILNPPRNGVDESIPALLAADGPPRLVYVSCDPATLARDLSRLENTYALKALHVIDMFPQTSHMETVAVLDRV